MSVHPEGSLKKEEPSLLARARNAREAAAGHLAELSVAMKLPRRKSERREGETVLERARRKREAAAAHPHYGWERNAGYGTAEHMEALRRHGPTPLHRRSFAPVAQLALL